MTKWNPEIRHFSPHVPIVLVGEFEGVIIVIFICTITYVIARKAYVKFIFAKLEKLCCHWPLT